MPTASGALTAAEQQQIEALVRAHSVLRAQLNDTAKSAASTAMRGFGGWWDDARVRRMSREIVRVVQPVQRRTAQVTDAYLSRAATVMSGRRVNPVGAVDVSALRRLLPAEVVERLAQAGVVALEDYHDASRGGQRPTHTPSTGPRRAGGTSAVADAVARPSALDPDEVYARIAEGYRYNVVAGGKTEEVAERLAIQRAEIVAETDVTLAMRAQADRFFRQRPAGVVGYRRVLRPELGLAGPPCGLCVVAADRIYHIGDLLPIHARCRCEIIPILKGVDPGARMNREDLDRIYAAAGSTNRADLKRIRVQIAEHGELGPILTNADHHFRGPREVAAIQTPDRATRARAQLAALETSYERLLERAAAGENVYRAIRWHEKKIPELREELGIG